MIKMVILDQRKPISLILEIKKFKIQKWEICIALLLFVKSEIRQVYNTF